MLPLAAAGGVAAMDCEAGPNLQGYLASPAESRNTN